MHTSLGAHIHYVLKFTIEIYFNVIQLNEDNAICGLHWHSRYSIVDFYIVLLHFRVVYRDLLWPTSIKCDQDPFILSEC